MTWRVRARDASGATRSFEREAASREELLAALREEHLLVLDVTAVRSRGALPPWWHPSWILPMTGFDVELGLRQIASLLRSGITVLEAVGTVALEASSPRGRRTWERIAAAIIHGNGFAAALAADPKRFGELTVRLCEVGEKSGELEHAVARAAEQMEARRNLRTQVVNALLYPLLAVAMAVGVSVFLVVAVIPKVAAFLQSGGASLPPLTQALMDFSEWFNAHGLEIGLGLVAAAAAWRIVRFNETGREIEDVLLLHIPVTGRILRLSGAALFARAMQIMTASGVTLLEALDTTSRLLANRRYRRQVAGVRAEVMRGVSLGDALHAAGAFTPMLRRMATVGERTGALPETFGEAAHFHETMLALAVRRFGMIIEPLMIFIAGGIVGFVYIAFFMAIFALAGTN